MKKIFLFLALFTTLIFAQSFQIKQITNLDADCRNFTSDFAGNSYHFVFEAHTGTSSSIYFGSHPYKSEADSFADFQMLVGDSFMNINPKLIYGQYDSLFLIYQTNKNGNWDIAYRVSWNNQPFGPVYYFADSSADEINPVVPTTRQGDNALPIFFSYQKGNSVYIKEVSHTNIPAFEVFHGDDSTIYSQVTQSNLYIAARKVVNGNSSIVYKTYDANGWSNEIVLVNTGTCRNPKIQIINNWMLPEFSYTDDINGKSNIILIDNYYHNVDTLKLFDYPHYNYDNLLTIMVPILTKMQDDIVITSPFTYKASLNDSLFIRVNKNDLGPDLADTLIFTKVKDSNLFLDGIGFTTGSNEVYYTIWEDSVNGHIQLFGRRFLYHISGVNDDKYSPASFTLFQNYPNPFNPTTAISYRLKETGFVKLNVYNITGKLIKTLVSQAQNPGSYEIQFNAKGLASGIYFYRLEVFGKNSSHVFSEIKKLVLLK